MKRSDRSEDRATGKVFVIAAHGIETPKLMLLSNCSAHPAGLGNEHDLVGRFLMDHPTQLSWALAKDPVYPYRGPLSTAGIEMLERLLRGPRPARAEFFLELADAWRRAGDAAKALPHYEAAIQRDPRLARATRTDSIWPRQAPRREMPGMKVIWKQPIASPARSTTTSIWLGSRSIAAKAST